MSARLERGIVNFEKAVSVISSAAVAGKKRAMGQWEATLIK